MKALIGATLALVGISMGSAQPPARPAVKPVTETVTVSRNGAPVALHIQWANQTPQRLELKDSRFRVVRTIHSAQRETFLAYEIGRTQQGRRQMKLTREKDCKSSECWDVAFTDRS